MNDFVTDEFDKLVSNIMEIEETIFALEIETFEKTQKLIFQAGIIQSEPLCLNIIDLILCAISYNPFKRNIYRDLLSLFIDPIKKHKTNPDIFYRHVPDQISYNIFYRNGAIDLPTIDLVEPTFLCYFFPEYLKMKPDKFLEMKNMCLFVKNFIDSFSNEKHLLNLKEEKIDDEFLEIIKKDEIDMFLNYISKYEIELGSSIDHSMFIYEYIPRIFNGIVSYIDYIAYWHSNEIFKYVILSKIKFQPQVYFYAIASRNVEVINILNDYNEINFQKELCISYSINTHDIGLFEYMINNFNDINSKDILLQSILSNNIPLFISYFEKHNSPQDDETLLYSSISCNNFVIFRIICEKCPNIVNCNIGLMTLPQFLIQNDMNSYLQTILQNQKLNINNLGQEDCNLPAITALHSAVLNNNYNAVKLLLQRNDLDINAVDSDNNETALHFACKLKNSKIIRALIFNTKINMNAQSSLNMYFTRTPTDISLKSLDFSNFMYLRKNGGKISMLFTIYLLIVHIIILSFFYTIYILLK
ncbi:hypothetical protein TRFO_32013 [Tritrichomonas foetus]|uniref:Uncharacterized protein n=1 Tax=Tritrichomonas foetus TaxID=1144522 RepID=A0A1J4JUM9_9EUKA|nr:hypothetical protein TRFO_32013 [Tritrichomonas foetus]|eukprot:OHT01228.1 hypothetical protein TRFO_32013 [Tritrichomonas foetus]